MANSMHCIQIYRYQGTWAFTDVNRELIDEPFVSGIPQFIDFIIRQTENDPTQGEYRVTFSKNQFPTATYELRFVRDDMNGAWYDCRPVDDTTYDKVGGEGWLCPATLAFFEDFPRSIFVEITPVR